LTLLEVEVEVVCRVAVFGSKSNSIILIFELREEYIEYNSEFDIRV
jgi:hypothetical protein